jgi:cell wall-associated NlpC family hydrolase
VIQIERYLSLGFAKGGRERPLVDCWGLYRLIVGEQLGVWLEDYAGTEELRAAARVAKSEASNWRSWVPVPAGEERPLDLVLLTGLITAAGTVHAAPVHVGCVLEPGRMIDIEETTGVMVRAYRSTSRVRASASVANRVRGIFRPAVLA